MVAGTISEGTFLASVPLVGVGSASHYVGGHERCGRFSGLFAWSTWDQKATVVAAKRGEGVALASNCLVAEGSGRALLCHLFARSAWALPATVLAGTIF